MLSSEIDQINKDAEEAVRITRIKIKIGGQEIDVTLNEARQLKDAMDEIFPALVAPIQITYNNQPYYYPATPYPDYWQFGAVTGTGGVGTSHCTATLDIKVGDIIAI
jgi:hypothetical protein